MPIFPRKKDELVQSIECDYGWFNPTGTSISHKSNMKLVDITKVLQMTTNVMDSV